MSSFKAKYHGDVRESHVSIWNSVGVGEKFSDRKILKKVDSPFSQNPWQTEAILSADEREYEMEGLRSMLMHATSVRVCHFAQHL